MEIIGQVLTDQNFLGAILGSFAFILIGFILRHFNIVNKHGKEVLNILVMKVAIPCMAFCAFMSDFSSEQFLDNVLIFVFDIGFYVVSILIGNLIFLKKERDQRRIYAILMAVGQLTLFSMPILEAVYGLDSGVLIPASMMSIAFRLVVYIYAYIAVSGEKITKKTFGPTMKRIFVNPVMIMMFLGLIIYLTQNVVFQVDVQVGTETVSYGFTRIDKTLPALYKIFQLGNNLATPLAMLLMGITLGEANFLSAIKNRTAWILSIGKAFIFPFLVLGVIILFQMTGVLHLSEIQTACLVIGNAAPASAVVVVFCVNYNKEAYVGSDSVMLSTLLSIISMPLLFVVIKLCMTLPCFA
jgi:malate permease and related proteins